MFSDRRVPMSAKLNLIDCRALFEPKLQQVLSSLVALSVNAMQLTGRTLCAEELILFTDAKDLSEPDRYATDKDTLFCRTICEIDWKLIIELAALNRDRIGNTDYDVDPLEGSYKYPHNYREWRDTKDLFFRAYDKLDAEQQSTLGATFAGLMSQAMRDPDFATLCADPDVSASGLSLEQRMKTPLDPQALYAFAQSYIIPA